MNPSAACHDLRRGWWGAGSARTVNRRYIALFVAYKDRTWASALFVSLSAVGMALGPLLSLPLSLFPTRHFAGLTFDHVRPWTAPSCHQVYCSAFVLVAREEVVVLKNLPDFMTVKKRICTSLEAANMLSDPGQHTLASFV